MVEAAMRGLVCRQENETVKVLQVTFKNIK